MLTNLDWIGTGKPFPPRAEEKRLDRYEKNEKLFEGKHKDVFGKDFYRLSDYLKKRNIDVNTVINYPQLLTKKTADFVCGEPPEIETGTHTDELNDKLDEMNFSSMLYESMMDVSRFGNAPVKVLEDRVSIIPPEHWFPIVDPYDQKNILQHVIAFVVEGEIYVEIHDIGRYEVRRYKAKEGAIKDHAQFGELLWQETKATGADDCAVKVLANVSHSKSVYGIDDYAVISDILRQLMWRLYCMDIILDKHSMPSMTGPSNALTQDPVTGKRILVTGNYFTRERQEDAKPEYLTWDGNLSAVQWEIDWLTNQLYTLSEMGAAFLEGAGKGEANSGTALKLRMTSPVIKARRIAGINTQVMKQLVRLVAQANGMRVDIKDISIRWNDGLPDDRKEQAEILERATGGKPYMSQFGAVKQWGGYDDAAAQAEIDQIDGEESTATPQAFMGVSQFDERTEENTDANQVVPTSAGRFDHKDRTQDN